MQGLCFLGFKRTAGRSMEANPVEGDLSTGAARAHVTPSRASWLVLGLTEGKVSPKRTCIQDNSILKVLAAFGPRE